MYVKKKDSVAVESDAFLKNSMVGCYVSYLGNKAYTTGTSFADALENATKDLGVSNLSKCEYDRVDAFPLDYKRIHLYPLDGVDYYLNKNTVFASQILSNVRQGNMNPVVLLQSMCVSVL